MSTITKSKTGTAMAALAAALLLSTPVLAAEHPGSNAEHPGEQAEKDEHPGKKAAKDEHPGKKAAKDEHPGKKADKDEHPGKKAGKDEHPGDKADDHKHGGDHEHPGDSHEHPGSASAAPAAPAASNARAKRDSFEQDDFGEAEIKAAMRDYIQRRTVDGAFRIHDDKTGETLDLAFVKIHDPVRFVDTERGYFACTDFHVVGDDNKLYDLDFWLVPSDGELAVYREKIHKEPIKPWHRIGWDKQARYTFVDNRIAPVN